MRSRTLILLATSATVAIGCSTNDSTGPASGAWGSAEASLTIEGDTSTLQLLASGGCVGSYAVVEHAIPTGAFDLPATFTQLIGAYPGKVSYAAEIIGTHRGQEMSMAVTVPAIPRVIGPFALIRGVTHTWSNCLYP